MKQWAFLFIRNQEHSKQMADTIIRARVSGHVIPLKAVDNGDGTYSLGVSAPENEEVVVLASAVDNGLGRVSDDIENKYGRGLALLADVTDDQGGFAVNTITLEAKVGTGYVQLASFNPGMSNSGQFMFLLYPGLPDNSPDTIPIIVPRTYRISTVAAGGDGGSITYSITAVHLL